MMIILNLFLGVLFLVLAVAVFIRLRGRRLVSELAMFLFIVILVLEGIFNRTFNLLYPILLIGFFHYLIIYNIIARRQG